MTAMHHQPFAVKVTIIRFAEAYPPGIIECSLVDIDGREFVFHTKQYNVSEVELDWDSDYPRDGSIGCIIVDPPAPGQVAPALSALPEQATIEIDDPVLFIPDDGTRLFRVSRDQIIPRPNWL